MKKVIFFVVLGLFASRINALSILGCPNGQVLSPQGCIADCNAPEWDRCDGMMFIAIYNPSFCAWTTNNQWRSYTFDCQACQAQDVIGFKDGQCTGQQSTDNPQEILKPIRKPVISKPLRPNPSNPINLPLRCSHQRPSEDQCPTLQYLRAPDLNFCGLTKKGTLQGFDRACSACKDQSVASYWETSCQNLQNSVLSIPRLYQPGQRITKPRYTRAIYCQSKNECQHSWQICANNKCIDSCAAMRCAGECNKGVCYPRLQK